MKWNAVLAETAVAELSDLPVQLQQLVIARIERLEEAPSTVSRRCPSIPGPPNCMQSTLLAQLDDRWHYLRILFRFDSNETDLQIIGVGHVLYAELPPDVEAD
jgi:hypothetical protein